MELQSPKLDVGTIRANSCTGARPALLGGERVRTAPWPKWPVFDRAEEQALLDVLHTGNWYRLTGHRVDSFERSYAKLLGAGGCLATASGTTALLTSLASLGVGPGDEVILPPYTFAGTLNAILALHALPVFVDIDRETFQIDHSKIEQSVTTRTVAIVPVHFGGHAVDVDALLALADKHNLQVLEDACQSHFAEWRGRKLGTFGVAGCFSFGASKNLISGDGGAIVSNNENFLERCYAYHNNGRLRDTVGYDFSYIAHGLNLRMTEFQAALLLVQLARIEDQTSKRIENAAYLTSLLQEIPGIQPVRAHHGCNRPAYHLYAFRYDSDQFEGLPRSAFIKALCEEGIPASSGYRPLNREQYLIDTLHSRAYTKIYPDDVIGLWEQRNHCPQNDKLCREAVWLRHYLLLGTRMDIEQIAEAVHKISAYAGDLVRATR
jgi:dTDP-4-amino-4,6-dideoxygalactose transaminase